MERSWFSTIGSLFTATLFAGALLLSGCSDSLTGTQPAQEDVTVQTNDADTDPAAGHNVSNED
jgi:PBP1b-binding outer membrane lipoprotein LpoB